MKSEKCVVCKKWWRSAQHLSHWGKKEMLVVEKGRHTAVIHTGWLSGTDMLWGAHSSTTGSNNSTHSCLPFCTKLMCKWGWCNFDQQTASNRWVKQATWYYTFLNLNHLAEWLTINPQWPKNHNFPCEMCVFFIPFVLKHQATVVP